MDEPNVWRKVNGAAVLCKECVCNKIQPLTGNGDTPIGLKYLCTAETDLCVRLKKPIQNDRKAYLNFKDMFNDPDYPDNPTEEEQT